MGQKDSSSNCFPQDRIITTFSESSWRVTISRKIWDSKSNNAKSIQAAASKTLENSSKNNLVFKNGRWECSKIPKKKLKNTSKLEDTTNQLQKRAALELNHRQSGSTSACLNSSDHSPPFYSNSQLPSSQLSSCRYVGSSKLLKELRPPLNTFPGVTDILVEQSTAWPKHTSSSTYTSGLALNQIVKIAKI